VSVVKFFSKTYLEISRILWNGLSWQHRRCAILCCRMLVYFSLYCFTKPASWRLAAVRRDVRERELSTSPAACEWNKEGLAAIGSNFTLYKEASVL
jgi:hypothetical protein